MHTNTTPELNAYYNDVVLPLHRTKIDLLEVMQEGLEWLDAYLCGDDCPDDELSGRLLPKMADEFRRAIARAEAK